jgi:hypothetical protein
VKLLDSPIMNLFTLMLIIRMMGIVTRIIRVTGIVARIMRVMETMIRTVMTMRGSIDLNYLVDYNLRARSLR